MKDVNDEAESEVDELRTTDWVEVLRKVLEYRIAEMDARANPDEKAFISSLLHDLQTLSHNLAVRSEASLESQEDEYITFSDYHYENGNRLNW
jgi:hypothetical protein